MDNADARAGEAGAPAGGFIGRTFRYNRDFLPEYGTTVGLSLVNTAIVVALEGKAMFSRWNPHFIPATLAYVAVVLVLLWLTFHARIRYCSLTVRRTGIERTFLGFVLTRCPFDQIDYVEEWRDSFFGRSARFLLIAMRSAETLTVTDFIRGYDCFREGIVALERREVRKSEPLADDQYERLAAAAKERDSVFAPQEGSIFQRRVPLRVTGLVPVWGVDFLITLVMIHRWFKDRGVLSELVIYSAALGLAVSAVVARYTYYYIFSSARLRRR